MIILFKLKIFINIKNINIFYINIDNNKIIVIVYSDNLYS